MYRMVAGVTRRQPIDTPTNTMKKRLLPALLLPALFIILWANGQAPLPIGILLLIVAVPVIVIVCIVAVLIQRIKEIKGGEEDEAAQY